METRDSLLRQWADYIDDLLIDRNWTQRHIADLCGVDESQVSRWRKAKQMPGSSARVILTELAERE